MAGTRSLGRQLYSLVCLIALGNQSHSGQIKDFMTQQKPNIEEVGFVSEACKDSCCLQPRYFTAKSNDAFWVFPSTHHAHGAAGGQGLTQMWQTQQGSPKQALEKASGCIFEHTSLPGCGVCANIPGSGGTEPWILHPASSPHPTEGLGFCVYLPHSDTCWKRSFIQARKIYFLL